MATYHTSSRSFAFAELRSRRLGAPAAAEQPAEPAAADEATSSIATVVVAPSMAFGTGSRWKAGPAGNSADPGTVSRPLVDTIKAALRAGFRHIDCAEYYGTEREAGLALGEFRAETGLPRSAFFLTTKVSTSMSDVSAALDAALARLGAAAEGYVDLYLVHMPFFPTPPSLRDVWAGMLATRRGGRARAVGVSNYRIADLEATAGDGVEQPAVNQVEFHPRWLARRLRRKMEERGVALASYGGLGPLAAPDKFPGAEEVTAVVAAVAERVAERERERVRVLRATWALRQGAKIVVTTTSREDRMREYLASPRVAALLTDDDVAAITDAAAGFPQKHKSFEDKKLDDDE
ncbi:NADP-dependent oxidoreductase domain-containing protein [Zopfochytrium polystomum]|nr:NADP-dependent oxidoreductase domain-containing protein [Zopfochytrium polystomum]